MPSRKSQIQGLLHKTEEVSLSDARNEVGDEKSSVRQHIESFPVTKRHYCREGTKRKYLNRELNLQILYDMYAGSRREQGKCPVSRTTHKNIFYEEYNFDFFRSLKDPCDHCTSYENLPVNEKEDLKEDTNKHHAMKAQARQEKELDEIKSDYCTSVGSNFYGMRELLVVGLTRLVPAFSNTSADIHREERKCCRSPQTPAVAKTTTNTSWDFFGMHNKNLTRMKYVKAFFYIWSQPE